MFLLFKDNFPLHTIVPGEAASSVQINTVQFLIFSYIKAKSVAYRPANHTSTQKQIY